MLNCKPVLQPTCLRNNYLISIGRKDFRFNSKVKNYFVKTAVVNCFGLVHVLMLNSFSCSLSMFKANILKNNLKGTCQFHIIFIASIKVVPLIHVLYV